MPYKIRIGGLSATATPSLESLFSPFGTVLSVEFEEDPPPDGDSEVQGFSAERVAVVTFEDEAAGQRAVEEMNGVEVEGHVLTVTPLSLRPPPPRLPPLPPPPL